MIVLPSIILISCTGKVNNESSIKSAVESMAQQNSVTLISNSTQAQNKCESGNKVVLQVALSSIAKYFCRDTSRLMDSMRLGPVCDGGANIVPLEVDRSVKDCHELTLCGKKYVSSVDITQRIDGTSVQQLTFDDLPWGCQGGIEASVDPNFSNGEVQTVSLQVLPPSCPFCEAVNGVTCETCISKSSSENIFVAGQLIPKTCSGAGCATCLYPPANSPSSSLNLGTPESISHGGTRAFYSTAIAVCGQPCMQVQQIRVCNNGNWVPGNDINFPTQCQEPASNSCVITNSFFNRISNSVKDTLGINSKPNLKKMDASDTVTCSDCQSGACGTCTTVGGTPGFTLYSSTTVPYGSTCEAVNNCQACSGGFFQGSTAYKYKTCAVLSAPCRQHLINPDVSSGSSRVFYNGGSCDPINLQCVNGVWKDSSDSAISQATVESYSDQCVRPTDCVTQGGISILNGNSQYVFNTNEVDSTDSCYSSSHYKYLGCASGAISPSDPGTSFRYKDCKTKTCKDPRDPLKTINAGATLSYWSVASANCSSLPDPSTYCNNNKVTFTCATTGGTATISPAGSTLLANYTNTSCNIPASCSSCVFNKTDASSINVTVNSTISLFKTNTSNLCQGVGAVFKCVAGIGNNPPALSDNTGGTANAADYPYLNCSPTGGNDQGSLGGTGGGTGNDSGPGSALKKRFGASEGSSAGGVLGCVDAVNCPANYSKATQPFDILFSPCLLPWANQVGEIEFYGSFNAFSLNGLRLATGTTDTVCVVKPDLCSNHRQSRTCHFPTMTGSRDFVYPNCVEKESCP